MILIKNAEVFSPKKLGVKDLLVAGSKIVFLEEGIEIKHPCVQVVEAEGKKVVPGFIDQHVHITGGGGEGGFKTRAPEITLSKIVKGGITTLVGVLGTDGISRSIENLVAKAKALNDEGLTVFAVTGSYAYPSITLTGSVMKDIAFISEVIGVKIAISDHRSSSLTDAELARTASEARMAGMIAGKAGIVITHMGNGKRGLKPLLDLMSSTDIPVKTFRPTHVNREKSLCDEALVYAKAGGMIDLNPGKTGYLSTAQTIERAKEQGVPLENITLSSDGYGSWSRYDKAGNLIEMGVTEVNCLYDEFVSLVKNSNMLIEDVLPFFTSNVAAGLGLSGVKGCVSQNADADFLLLDNDLQITSVFAKGKIMMHNKNLVVKGTYEK